MRPLFPRPHAHPGAHADARYSHHHGQAGQILYAPPISALPTFTVGEIITTVKIPQDEEAEAAVVVPVQPVTQVRYGHILLPVEVVAYLRTVIRTAVDKGITVVEAAGNGGFNLDGVVNPTNGHRFLDRDHPGFEDSGAIMVAAGHAPGDDGRWQRKPSSNYGSRIDCFAQGSGIYTSLVDSLQSDIRNGYYGGFGDTSGAAAIVAGVLLAFQGVVNARRGEPLPPQEARAALKGTTPVPAQQIGEMPDLRAMIATLDLDD